MDPISSVLDTISLSGVIFLRADLGGQYGIEIPPPTDWHPLLKPLTPEHRLVMFHIVREGTGYVEVEGFPPCKLEAGDLIIVFDDRMHSVVDSPGRATERGDDLEYTRSPALAPPAVKVGDGETTMRLVCGMLQFVERGMNPLFSALPPYLHIRRDDGPSSEWLQSNINHIIAEAESGRPGTEALLGRLTELLFVETLRAYLRNVTQQDRGWFAALVDPVVGKALAALHANPAHPWTVAELARVVAVSRSGLASRFAELLDSSPIAYLTRWRLRIATNMLEDGNETIAEIAHRVGYESESAFNRAFRREMGLPPAAWRRNRIGGSRPNRQAPPRSPARSSASVARPVTGWTQSESSLRRSKSMRSRRSV